MARFLETVFLAVAGGLAVYLQGCGQTQPAGHQCTGGPKPGENCADFGCCAFEGQSCYRKDQSWAGCMETCKKGPHDEDPKAFRTPWSCEPVKPKGPVTTTTEMPVPKGWLTGTWTTGYWDCCKPSCSWKGKGKVNKPVAACDVRTGKPLKDLNEKSVCKEGGNAATCANQMPFVVNSGLSMGFAAAAVGSKRLGLDGDGNCGQCYELRFTNERHTKGKDTWGGAAGSIVGKRMIIQVTNIGYDVTGNHSFDIMIPGAGMGLFKDGCSRQFPDNELKDFDCGKHYGGCDDISGCDNLPKDLQAGCKWRYEWYKWDSSARTNNPYVQFQRVRCPHQLTSISGTIPEDDDKQTIVI